ncbi:MAG: ribosome maturation factor RimP [Aestuariivita sp.]|nr:ribosome maturation factor RimP [Aestuariivita sp.]
MSYDLIAKSNVERHVAGIVSPVLNELGFELVRVRLILSEIKTLQIMADNPKKGIDVDDCAEISNSLSMLLDVESSLPDAYSLEISSPGIDRPLTRIKDFMDFAGREAKLETYEPIDGRRRFRGILAGFEDGEVLITMNETTIGLKIDWLSDARLIITEDLIKDSLSRKTVALNHAMQN